MSTNDVKQVSAVVGPKLAEPIVPSPVTASLADVTKSAIARAFTGGITSGWVSASGASSWTLPPAVGAATAAATIGAGIAGLTDAQRRELFSAGEADVKTALVPTPTTFQKIKAFFSNLADLITPDWSGRAAGKAAEARTTAVSAGLGNLTDAQCAELFKSPREKERANVMNNGLTLSWAEKATGAWNKSWEFTRTSWRDFSAEAGSPALGVPVAAGQREIDLWKQLDKSVMTETKSRPEIKTKADRDKAAREIWTKMEQGLFSSVEQMQPELDRIFRFDKRSATTAEPQSGTNGIDKAKK